MDLKIVVIGVGEVGYNLVKVLSNGEKVSTHGVVRTTVIAPALALAAQGIAITNNLTENFCVPKTITAEVKLASLGYLGNKTYKEVAKLAEED